MATSIYLSQLFDAEYPSDNLGLEFNLEIVRLLTEGVADLEKSKITQLELES